MSRGSVGTGRWTGCCGAARSRSSRTARFLLYLGGAVGTVLGSRLANHWDRITIVRWSYLITVGGIVSPLIGTLADHTSLRTALAPLIVLPALGWLMIRALPEPTTAAATTALP